MTKILGIIPARYGSSRFPGKALAKIGDKSMISRVYEQASKAQSLSKVVVATDHPKIFEHVDDQGGKVFMTSPSHQSGTDRCYEAMEKVSDHFDYVINIQGDEPFIAPEQIDLLASCLKGGVQLGTLVKKIEDLESWNNPNVVKVLVNHAGDAIYFSRSPLPYLRNTPPIEWLRAGNCFKHIGIYAYRKDVLEDITMLSQSPLELAESLEQLRWIENGYKIKTVETTLESHGIDTPEDLETARAFLKRRRSS